MYFNVSCFLFLEMIEQQKVASTCYFVMYINCITHMWDFGGILYMLYILYFYIYIYIYILYTRTMVLSYCRPVVLS